MAQTPANASRQGPLSSQDALTACLLFLALATLFALTRSHWLDDWDSVNFAFALDDFDVTRHRPHPPGYPIYVAAGKLVHLVIADHARALTLLSAIAGAAVASMFYLLERRHSDWPVALCAGLIMALSPLFWLQSGLALTDMFGMVFVLAFLLVEGSSPSAQRGDLVRRLACGLIAGLALGARPHVAFLILVYWGIRAFPSRSVDAAQVLTVTLALLAGVAAWFIPAALATGGPAAYLHATIGQFEWRFGKPGVSVLGSSIGGEYLISRAAALIGSLGQAFAPMHLTAEHVARRVGLALLVIGLYVAFAWRSASKEVARPYILASAVYVVMLFILLPVGHLRYFLPLSLIVGWAASGYLAQFVNPVVRAVAFAPLLAVTVLPSLFLVGGLAKVPPPVAALYWVKSNRPAAILYSDYLRQHAAFYWRQGETRSEPKSEAECARLRERLRAGRIVLATRSELCGIGGTQIASFKRDARIHDKHHRVAIFEFGE